MDKMGTRKLPFHVVEASSEDPEHPASNLNRHDPHTAGWMSARFCEYPQQLVLAFDEGMVSICQVQLLSHQSNIATKIELYSGAGADPKTAKFKRLGYLSLDSNERSNYRARELKSVYVDTTGNYLKLVVHRCYLNSENLMNQVGVVAISVLGSASGGAPSRAVADASDHAPVGRPGVHDLAMDMQLDPATAEELRRIRLEKDRAVAAEDYDTAKRLKHMEERILSLGAQLAKLNADKAAAVSAEDYDTAKAIKLQIDHLKASIFGGGAPTNQPEPRYQQRSMPPSQQSHPSRAAPPPQYAEPEQQYDDEPASPVAAPSRGNSQRQLNGPAAAVMAEERAMPRGASSRSIAPQPAPASVIMDPDDLPIKPARDADPYGSAVDNDGMDGRPASRLLQPAPASQYNVDVDDEARAFGRRRSNPDNQLAGGGDASQLAGVEGADALPPPDKLTQAAMKDAAGLIPVFGEYITQCYFSKAWQLRDAALQKIQLDMNAFDVPHQQLIDACCKVMFIAADSERIAQVYLQSVGVLRPVLAMAGEVRKADLLTSLDGPTSAWVEKLGDSNTRNRDAAQGALEELARSNVVGPSFVAGCLLRKLPKKSNGWRPLSARIRLLLNLIEIYGMGPQTGLSSDRIIGFLKENEAFEHSNAAVRDAARDICVEMYKVEGESLVGRLSHLRKKLLDEYKETFKTAASGPTAPAATRSRAAMDAKHPEEEEPASPAPRQPKPKAAPGKAAAGHAAASAPAAGGGHNGKPGPKGHGAHAHAHAHHPQEEPEETYEDDTGEGDPDGQCQFCGWQLPEGGGEQQMDMHYWQDCPMLTQCPACQQVIEVSMLTQHLLSECEHHGKYRRCERCGEPVAAGELRAHVKAAACVPESSPDVANRCPLCHKDIEAGENGWYTHLLDQGCPANQRSVGH